MEGIEQYTKSSPERIAAMMLSLNQIEANDIPGDVVECGVWRGGNIILARKICPLRVCWLYDTFIGMTKPDINIDRHRIKAKFSNRSPESWIGKSAVSVAELRSYLAENDVLDDSKLRFVEGDVVETLQVVRPEQIALLRLDTDWYASTAAELRWLYPLLSPGGILIVDDYGHWLGARRAVDEYFAGSIEMEKIDYTAIRIVKPC